VRSAEPAAELACEGFQTKPSCCFGEVVDCVRERCIMGSGDREGCTRGEAGLERKQQQLEVREREGGAASQAGTLQTTAPSAVPRPRLPKRFRNMHLLVSPAVLMGLLLLLSVCTAGSEGLPRSTRRGSMPRSLAKGDAPLVPPTLDEASCCSSSGCSARGGGDRMTSTSSRNAPAESDDGRKSRR
ncbi:unnamed protein product, partial [Ectocarpus sp. 12 AP-2014]